ncbi:MAG TPA: hypothetical protein VFO46_12565 [Candidatus Sulfotelmatobacter sp.]|nr:hypothetical protein [Candidatus Sulfotelmatobacter sp.]
MTTPLRPLSTGELLDRTFSLYRSHFGLFLAIYALPHLFVLAFQCLGVALEPSGTQLANLLARLPWFYGAIVLTWIFGAISQAATVMAVSQVHLDRSTSVIDAYSRVKKHLLGVLGLSFMVGLAAGACLILIVPGIMLFVMWSLSVQAKVLEDKGVFDAMTRSSDLTRGRRWRIFVIWILFFLLAIVVSQLLQWPINLAAGVSGSLVLQRVSPIWQIASLAATFISECLVGPLATIAFSLIYYDERVRKEAFDLQLMMMTLDAQPAANSPVQVGA